MSELDLEDQPRGGRKFHIHGVSDKQCLQVLRRLRRRSRDKPRSYNKKWQCLSTQLRRVSISTSLSSMNFRCWNAPFFGPYTQKLTFTALRRGTPFTREAGS